MRRRSAIVPIVALQIAALLAAAPAAGIAAQEAATPVPAACEAVAVAPAAFPLTLTDDLGRGVVLAEAPERIVSIAPSTTEIVYALGLEDALVGVDAFSDYPPEAREKPLVGGMGEPDLEKIVAAEPDLVLAAGINVGDTLDDLDALGVPTLVLEPAGLDGVLDTIATVGQAGGAPGRAAELACGLRQRIDAVAAAVAGAPAPEVFVEISPDLYTAGPGSFIDDVLARAGGANVAREAEGLWPQLSAEALVAADPDVILLADDDMGVTVEQVVARPGWGGIAAVENGAIHVVDADTIQRPGPRVVDALEEIARILHPDRFPAPAAATPAGEGS